MLLPETPRGRTPLLATIGTLGRAAPFRTITLGLASSMIVAICVVVAGPVAPVPAKAQAMDRPNILLIVTDDQRADTLPAMPKLLDRIAGPGIRFGKGFVPHALCCPARASILTGNNSHTTGVWDNGLETGYRAFNESSTLATWLDDGGYRTGLFGKYLNHWADDDPTHVPPGWDEWFAFTENCCGYYGFTANVNGTLRDFGDNVYSTTESAQRAAGFILSDVDTPTFVLWTPEAPHAPAKPEAKYEGAFADLPVFRPPNYMEKDVSDKPRWVRSAPIWGSVQRGSVDALRRRMYETLLSVDDGIDLLIDALATSGRLSNTLIVFTSDNGVLLGEHRFQGKPFAWRAAHRVPFVVRYDPLADPPGTSRALVLTIDIAPTIVELAGVVSPTMEGNSLIPILGGQRTSTRSQFVIEHAQSGKSPPYCGARSQSALFVRHSGGAEEFYDYRRDQWELRNLIADPRSQQRIARHRRFTRERCFPRPPGFSW